MKAARLEREIKVVEVIIGQLNKCLAIYHKHKMHDEFRITLKDIQMCKEELQKLKSAKEAEMEAEKGAAINVNTSKRSGENVL